MKFLIFIIFVSSSVFAGSSLYERGKVYFYGDDKGIVDYEKAFNIFSHASKMGDLDAQTALGIMYIEGRGTPNNDQKGIVLLEKSANKEHAKAQYYLGAMYYLGIGTKQDLKKAHQWIKKAALQSHVDAQYNLAQMYEKGRGTDKDLVLANKWYDKSAKLGNKDSQYYLAKTYEQDKNYRSALSWYEKAAKQGHADAQYHLGEFYKKGNSVVQNHKEALYWYEKASENNHTEALGALGLIYNLGLGTEKDYKKAQNYYQRFRKAKNLPPQHVIDEQNYKTHIDKARSGDKASQHKVAVMYKNGIGVERSIKKAKYWLRKLAKSGDQKAKIELDKLQKR